jgi:hypothetical protein
MTVLYIFYIIFYLLFNTTGMSQLKSFACLLQAKKCSYVFRFHRANWDSPTTVTVVFPCFFLSCKANARVYLAVFRRGTVRTLPN